MAVRACFDPASFRDPGGSVFYLEKRVLRRINPVAAARFSAVQETGLLDKLVEKGWITASQPVEPSTIGEVGLEAAFVIEHERIPFISYPYEWGFQILKAAALHHLAIQCFALDHNVALSDASAYNIQFLGARPVFIDLLSFVPYREGAFWLGHKQFCEQFLNPLLLRSLLGVSHNAWYRGTQEGIPTTELNRLVPWHKKLSWSVFSQVVLQASFQASAQKSGIGRTAEATKQAQLPKTSFRAMLEGLQRLITRLEPAERTKTVWADYARTHSYSDSETEAKKRFVHDFATKVEPACLWDFGCNTGDYSKVALDAGAKSVVGFDFDQNSLDIAFDRSRTEALNFLPLFLDAANPTPNQGWAGQERRGLLERSNADGLLALAFVHHLAITRNIPLPALVDWLVAFAPCGVIEFVPKEDTMVQELLRLREDIFVDYTEAAFLGHVAERARVVRSERVSASGRTLVWYDRT
jgi:ribosomal protein L11 methylase PrmA